jgi:hypothetical protein
MKHAGRDALQTLEPLLRRVRAFAPLVEKSPGSFYLRSKAFLHFHEDPGGLFADLKEDLVSFSRYRVTTRAEQDDLVARVRRCLGLLKS